MSTFYTQWQNRSLCTFWNPMKTGLVYLLKSRLKRIDIYLLHSRAKRNSFYLLQSNENGTWLPFEFSPKTDLRVPFACKCKPELCLLFVLKVKKSEENGTYIYRLHSSLHRIYIYIFNPVQRDLVQHILF